MLYLTMVLFFFVLLVVLFVVKLLFRLERRDTIKHDQSQLWEKYNVDLKDMRSPKQNK